MVRSLTLNSGPNRYSEGVIRSPALASATDVETYLTPIPSNPNSYVVSTGIRPNPEVYTGSTWINIVLLNRAVGHL